MKKSKKFPPKKGGKKPFPGKKPDKYPDKGM